MKNPYPLFFVFIALISVAFSHGALAEDATTSSGGSVIEREMKHGMAALKEGKNSEALTAFREVKRLNSNFAPAYVGEAEVLTIQNAWDEALALLNRAIKLDPNFGIAYHNRGILKYYQQRYLEAHADLRKAIELGETVSKDLLVEVWSAAFPGDAIKLMNDQIAANPKNGQAYLNRGILHFYNNEYQSTLNDWKKAKELGVQPDAEMWSELERGIQMEKGAKRAAS